MFAPRYFAPRYFAPRYFPGGAAPPAPQRVVSLAAARDNTVSLAAARGNTVNLEASQAMAVKSRFESYRGEDLTINFQLPESALGWTADLKVAATRGGAAVITRTASIPGLDNTVLRATVPAASTAGLAVTAAGQDYYALLERTDAGENAVLADVVWTLKPRPAV